ncbi:MAG TPA: tetratricopeptide repeat protein [Rhizomicrobium sp.]|nr:tetratricopeptide repeat protein [Rhizomicrobium sp.]
MTRAFLACVFLLCVGNAAIADGYRDFNLGAAASDRLDHDLAIKYLSSAIAAPDLPEHLRAVAYEARAEEYYEQQKYDLAIADYSAAIAAKSDWIDPRVGRCGAYDAQDVLDKAIADCTAAIEMQPDNWRLRLYRVHLYYETKDFAAIVADYSRFIAMRPDDGGLLVGRANALQLLGQFDKALADADAAHELASKWSGPFAVRGRVYFARGDFPSSADAWDSAVDRASGDAGAHLAYGQAEWAMGKFHRASSAFEDSLDQDKDEHYAFLWLFISKSLENAKVPQDIVAHFSSMDLARWPGPLVQLYLGKTTPDALLAMKGPDPDTIDDYQCSVGFFVGEWYRMQGNAALAKQKLEAAANVCTAYTAERQYALVALSQLPQGTP